MSLRVKAVERFTIDVPFTPRCAEWNALLVWNWSIVEIVRVELDDGTVGWGETLPHYTWGTVSDDAVARVRGRNAVELLGDDSLGAGLQMALYDAVGKALGVPVHRLLNLPPVRDWCPIAWWNTKMPPDALAEEAKDAVAAGYTAHKIKVRPWLDVYAQVEAISAVTPPHYKLDLDWNDMLLNVGNAAPVIAELDRYERVALYEGPLPQRDVEGYQHLRRKTNRPIAIHFGTPPFATSVRSEMCDGFVMSWGGVSGLLRMGAQCAAFDKPFWLQMVGTGLTTALCAHIGSVLTHAQWPAVTCLNNFADDLLTEPLTIRHGTVRVPDGPGLGVTFDESALAKYAMQPPYVKPERRHVLSVVWPSGRVVHYAHMIWRAGNHSKSPFAHAAYEEFPEARRQCWEDFLAGNQPIEMRGVRLEVWKDDGTPEWNDLYDRARRGPVLDRR